MTTNEFKTFLKANFGNPIRVYTLKNNKLIFRATFTTLTRIVGELVLPISVIQYNSENGVIDFINTDHDSEVCVESTTFAAIITATEEKARDQATQDEMTAHNQEIIAVEKAAESLETITPTPVEETPVATATVAPKSKKAQKSAPVATPPAKKGKAPASPKVPAPTATPRVEKKAPPVAEKATTEKKAPAPRKGSGEFRWTEKRVLIVKALRALKANGELNARSGEEVQAKAGEEISLQDVKHYLYKDNDLVTNGFTGCIKGREGIKGIGYFLTEKGLKADLVIPAPVA